MKTVYKIALSVISALFLSLFSILIFKCSGIDNIIESSAVFVALFTSILAISISDKKVKKISFSVKIFGNKTKDRDQYSKSNLNDSIKPFFTKKTDPFFSYRVYFKITNTTKMVLKKPTITIKVPNSVKHPSSKFSELAIHSNIFNSSNDLQLLEYGETTILSNSNLPFLHPTESLKIWIRMCLDKDDTKSLFFHIALDSENANGSFTRVKISPNQIFTNIE